MKVNSTSAIPKGMFVFSKPQFKASDFENWQSWFKKKNIKTAIIETGDGRYVLCREGEESFSH